MDFEDIEQELVAATRGMMDGTLSTLGVVIGATGAPPEVIIAAGISGGLANSFSNVEPEPTKFSARGFHTTTTDPGEHEPSYRRHGQIFVTGR